MRGNYLKRAGAALTAMALVVTSLCSAGGVVSAEINTADFAVSQQQKFAEPEMKYKPYARWWLAEGSHTDQTLKESIQELYEDGFGGIEFVTLDESAYLDDATYGWGSPEWVHDSKLIIEECQRLGMSVSMTGGTNWSTANLTNITPDQQEASQELSYVTVEVAPGETFSGNLPQCKLPDGVTKQTLKQVVGIQVTEKGSATDSFMPGQFVPTKLDLESSVNLTGSVKDEDQDGVYELAYTNDSNLPVLVFAFYQHGTGESYKPAATGQSYTINYLSTTGADALIQYWDQNVLTDDVKQVISKIDECSMYMDSLELRARGVNTTGQLWCDEMFDEFQSRSGYDLTKYLPFLILQNAGGRVSSVLNTGGNFGNALVYTYEAADEQDREIAVKLQNDFYQTMTELYTENCLNRLKDWLHQHNMKLRAENSYGKTLEISQPIEALDYVETESFEFFTDLDLFRGMSGGAHLFDVRYSSETGANRWVNYYWNNDYYRQIFYMQYAAGIQKMVTHGYSSEYGPDGRVSWPGYEGMKDMYSERFNKRQPASIDYEEFYKHLTRIQKVLESGVPQMDIGILRTDYAYNNGSYTKNYPVRLDNYDNYVHNNKGFYWKDMTLQNQGYTYEYFSPHLLTNDKISCEGGLVNADGVGYQALIVMQDELPYDSAVQLLEWAKSGLPVVFVNHVVEEIGNDWEKRNTIAASTTGSNDGRDAGLEKVVAQIKEQPTVKTVDTQDQTDEALKALGVYPRAEYVEPNANLLSVMRKADDATYLYVYHYMYEDEAPYQSQISVDGVFQPYLLDTWSGEVSKVPDFEVKDGRTILNVKLDPGEIMVFALEPQAAPANSIVSTDNVYKVMDVDGQTVLAVTNSGKASATFSDGTVFTQEVSAPQSVTLSNWSLVVDSYEPGEKQIRTAKTEETGVTSTEVTYTTKHVMKDAGSLSKLVPWKDIPAIGAEVSGVGTYTNTFTLPQDWDNTTDGLTFDAQSYCGGTVSIQVNGAKIPVNMDRSTVDISDYVHQGENTIKVRVTTTLRNRMIVQGYSGWNLSSANPINKVEPDDYGMTGETKLVAYTKVPVPKLNVDKGILNKVIQYAQAKKADKSFENVIELVQKSFNAALENAQSVAADASVGQDAVDAAWKKLMNEIHKLGFVIGDKTSLSLLIDTAQGYHSQIDKYTPATAEPFTMQLSAAKAILADGNTMQDEVSAAENNLLNAMMELRFKADKSILNQLLAEANGIDTDRYTQTSVQTFHSAKEEAERVANDLTLTEQDQPKVNCAAETLRRAINGLTTEAIPVQGDSALSASGQIPKTGESAAFPVAIFLLLAAGACVMTKKHGNSR